MLRSSNPALKAFERPQSWGDFQGGGGSVAASRPGVMTIGGTIQAAGIQLAIAFACAIGAWVSIDKGLIGANLIRPISFGVMGLLLIGGFVLHSRPKAAVVLGPILAGAYGAFAGFFSYMVAISLGAMMVKNPGLIGESVGTDKAVLIAKGSAVVFQAMLLTIGVAGGLVLVRAFNIFRIGSKFRRVIVFATMAIAFVYIASMILNIFGTRMPLIHQTGPIGIAFSGFVVVLASLNLLLAFQTVEDGARHGMPKYMEWYAGYAVVSTMIWLYIEILFLLYKIYAATQNR